MDHIRVDFLRIPAGPVTVDLLDGDRICHHCRIGNGFEPDSLEAWARMAEEGDTVYDVGAYTGVYSIAAAKRGCYVEAFEPLPQVAARLAENIKLNGVNVRVHEVAVSDFNGTAELHYNAKLPLTSGASLVDRKHPGIKVEVVRLDDMPFHRVAAIKIDVERAEDRVLRGAHQIIEMVKPQLLIEALDIIARNKVKRLLPGYREAAFLDARNMHMVPA